MVTSSLLIAFVAARRAHVGGPAMIDPPDGFWQWVSGGLAALVASGAAVFGKMFTRRTDEAIKDIWNVIDTERKAMSEARERTHGLLQLTARRDEIDRQLHGIREEMREGFKATRAEILSIVRKD